MKLISGMRCSDQECRGVFRANGQVSKGFSLTKYFICCDCGQTGKAAYQLDVSKRIILGSSDSRNQAEQDQQRIA